MFSVTISRVFAAAHAIRLYDGALETVHGHNWTVDVSVASDALDDIEVVMDFHALEQTVDALLAKAHNGNLNDLPPFSEGVNPTAERVAMWIGGEVAKTLPDQARLEEVRVGEAPGCVATYRPASGV
ncbi:MAG: 6-carboxytetrahydropterin synthase QueD [Phycisphaeraceae bacterium]|nr:6-carboxytetrahydropterin synthase QueD [Phycisphaeraceae bacterium]